MIHSLEPTSMEVLSHFYNHFKNRIMDSQIKIEHKSLLLTVIKLPVNQLSRLLTDSTLNNRSFSQAELDRLAHERYVRPLGELGKPHDYAITVNGIWYVEFNKNDMDINRLLDYFQETKLSFKVTNKPLKDIEKTILFAMIAIRNFSAALPMDLNTPSFGDYWIEIFDMCTNYLYKIEAVSKEKWNTLRPGNEHPISYVMRRANDLPQKTIHIYQTLGKHQYFLNVDHGDTPPQKQLLFLYKLILGHVETKELIKDIHAFCCDVAYDKSKNVRETFEYINPEWDTILEEALTKLYYEA